MNIFFFSIDDYSGPITWFLYQDYLGTEFGGSFVFWNIIEKLSNGTIKLQCWNY